MLASIVELLKTGQRTKAIQEITHQVNNPLLIGAHWLTLARVSAVLGEVNSAKFAISKYSLDEKANSLEIAGLLAELGQHAEAIKIAQLALNENDSEPALNHFMGTICSQSGEVDKALTHFRKTLQKWPNSGPTWLALSALKTFSHHDLDFKLAIEQISAFNQNDELSAGTFFYGLGKMYHDIEEFDKAAGYYTLGAKLIGNKRVYRAEFEKKYIEATIRSNNALELNKLASSSVQKHNPIFIFGLPRSGTTLLENILSSHKDVVGGGEVDFFRKATMEMKGTGLSFARQFEQNFTTPVKAWDYLAEQYLHLVTQRFGKTGVIIDKTLNNNRHLGLLKHMFPKSPMIIIERNLSDTALSCFRTCFSSPMEWSWSMESIVTHFEHEVRILDHWKSLYSDKILIVPYEDLVTNPSVWIKKIFTHCNLETNTSDGVEISTNRFVTTASSIQVRGAINTKSINLSRHYSALTRPFLPSD